MLKHAVYTHSCQQLMGPLVNSFCLTDEEDEEEEFLESLPSDMMDEEDLKEMTAMARKASFITRDLSSW